MMKLKNFKKMKDGDWFRPQMKSHYMACCDCGLVHRLNFKIDEHGVLIQAFRAPRVTSKYRKGREK